MRVCCLLLLFSPGVVAAQTDAAGTRFELTVDGGYMGGGDFEDASGELDLQFDEAAALGLILDIRAEEDTQWEVRYLRQTTELATADLFAGSDAFDVDVHYLHFGGTLRGEGEFAQPYVVAGVGVTHLDAAPAELDDDTRASASIGGGVRLMPGQRVGLRLEGRVYGTVVDSDSEIFCSSAGEDDRCAIRVDGTLLLQWHASLGVIFRF